MFSKIAEIIQDIKSGKPVIITDDESRENEGDIIIPAQFITAEIVNFLIQEAKGLICVAISQKVADQFALSLHPRRNVKASETAFTYSIDLKEGITTGISAKDRADTILKLSDVSGSSDDFKVPGHVFPVIAKDGGIFERRGHTEAAIDIAKLADLTHAMVMCEIIKQDGFMARRDDISKFSKEHNLKVSSIEELGKYMRR